MKKPEGDNNVHNEIFLDRCKYQKGLDNKSMTQESLADVLSISNHAMSKIINGTKALNARELEKIASVLGTTIDSLLMANIESVQIESIAFMRTMQDKKIREKVEMLRLNIDEILLLEELSRV